MLTEITGKPVEPGELTAPPEEPRSSVRELLADRLRSRTTTTALIWIALNISYYGLFLWLPFVLQAEKSFSINVYLLLTLSALSQFPGYAAAIWLVERIGRKPTLAAFLILGGLSAYAFAVADTESVYVTALFFVGFFNLGAWGAVYPYTSETFPTRLRSTAFGVMEGVGKTAAIAGPVHLRQPERRDRLDDLVADVRGDRDGRRRAGGRDLRPRDPRPRPRLALGQRLADGDVERRQLERHELADPVVVGDGLVAQPFDQRPGDARLDRRDDVEPERREVRRQHRHLDDEGPLAAQHRDPLHHLAVGHHLGPADVELLAEGLLAATDAGEVGDHVRRARSAGCAWRPSAA